MQLLIANHIQRTPSTLLLAPKGGVAWNPHDKVSGSNPILEPSLEAELWCLPKAMLQCSRPQNDSTTGKIWQIRTSKCHFRVILSILCFFSFFQWSFVILFNPFISLFWGVTTVKVNTGSLLISFKDDLKSDWKSWVMIHRASNVTWVHLIETEKSIRRGSVHWINALILISVSELFGLWEQNIKCSMSILTSALNLPCWLKTHWLLLKYFPANCQNKQKKKPKQNRCNTAAQHCLTFVVIRTAA